MRKVSDEMATLEPLRSPLGLLKVLITVSANLDEDDDGETRGKRKTREKERDRQSEREHQSSLLDRRKVFALGLFSS